MKTNTLLIAGTVAFALSAGYQVRADHSLLPPRAKQLFDHQRMARPSDANEPNLVHVGPKGPAAKAPVSRELAPAATSASDPDLLARPLYTGRNPFRELRGEQFELAPYGKSKACEAGCTKDCCAKK